MIKVSLLDLGDIWCNIINHNIFYIKSAVDNMWSNHFHLSLLMMEKSSREAEAISINNTRSSPFKPRFISWITSLLLFEENAPQILDLLFVSWTT